MSVTVDEFRKDGWNVTEEGISLLKEWTELENPTFDQCLSMALNSDLRQFCKGEIGKEMPEVIKAPLILQLQEVVNIAAPMQHQVEHPRMLRAIFTDGGKKKIKGAELHGKVDSLRLNTPPGTKFLLIKDIPVSEELLVLGPGLIKNMGGHVEAMVNEWKASKQFINRSTASKAKSSSEDNKDDDGGPPPFVPYKIPAIIDKPVQQRVPAPKDISKDGNTKAVNLPNKTKGKSKTDGAKSNNAAPTSTVNESKEYKNDKKSNKAKSAEKRSSEANPKKERSKTPKANQPIEVGAIGTLQAPNPSESASAKPKNKPRKKADGKPADLVTTQQQDNESIGQTGGAKAAKSKRPEQQYYKPKPRDGGEQVSNSKEVKDPGPKPMTVTLRKNSSSKAAEDTVIPTENKVYTDQDRSSDNTRSADRGRGLGRGHSGRGRSRGHRGRGSSSQSNLPTSN